MSVVKTLTVVGALATATTVAGAAIYTHDLRDDRPSPVVVHKDAAARSTVTGPATVVDGDTVIVGTTKVRLKEHDAFGKNWQTQLLPCRNSVKSTSLAHR